MARKQKMKVYHGIPKSITDEHTVFYLEDNNSILRNVDRKYNTPVGIGCTNFRGVDGYVATIDSLDQLTIDFWLDSTNYQVGTDSTIISILNQTNDRVLIIDQAKGGKGAVWFSVTDGPNQHGQHNISTSDTQGLKHIRCTINGATISIYNNGKLVATKNVFKNWYAAPKKVMLFSASTNNNAMLELYNLKGSVVSDIHISNIDRGDYFPNLPQDFIEGKAIIKPRMNQQQIKGDPMYSQTATVKIPAFNSETSKLYYLNTDRSKGYLKSSPEVFDVVNADTWAANSTFKLKGLNGEIISGILDANTAICSVLSYGDGKLTSSETSNKKILKVDTVTGLAAGDAVVLNNTLTPGGTSALTRTVESVDTTNKLITFKEDITSSNVASFYLFETTVSSSLPVVKSQDGTTVAGTWSGLGTNQATFVLGTNSGLTGEDLYVEYSLAMPSGNSDFPELPNLIERAWGENGVEMKPVNKIAITDDFKGKVSGSVKECPHVFKYIARPTLRLPSEFEIEYPQEYYAGLEAVDGTYAHVTNKDNNNIPQQLYSFNLIEMVERKLGCEIPSRDKVQWLKDNLDSTATIEHHGYGVHPSGNSLTLDWYNAVMNNWTSPGGNHSSSQPTKLENATKMLSDRIDKNGFVHILVYTKANNNSQYSTVRTDYIRLHIALKLNSTFTALYCSNTRAREDVCNPVLIQKETKTVRRYLPSKECFTTECNYVKPTISDVNLSDKYVAKDETYLTTLGSGAYLVHTNIRFKNCINKLGLGINAYQYTNTPLRKTTVGGYTDLYTIRELSQPYPTDNLMYPPQNVPNIPCVMMTPYLLNANGELSLGLLVLELNANGARTSAYTKAYALPNKPLIK